MNTQLEPIVTVPVRIRFAGTHDANTFHLTAGECDRFHSEWKAYLDGAVAQGGEYACEEVEHPHTVSLNFSQIAYTEPARVY